MRFLPASFCNQEWPSQHNNSTALGLSYDRILTGAIEKSAGGVLGASVVSVKDGDVDDGDVGRGGNRATASSTNRSRTGTGGGS